MDKWRISANYLFIKTCKIVGKCPSLEFCELLFYDMSPGLPHNISIKILNIVYIVFKLIYKFNWGNSVLCKKLERLIEKYDDFKVILVFYKILGCGFTVYRHRG